jgi:hypothetical protein
MMMHIRRMSEVGCNKFQPQRSMIQVNTDKAATLPEFRLWVGEPLIHAIAIFLDLWDPQENV